VLLAWLSGLPIEEIAYLTIRNTELRGDANLWLRDPELNMPEGFESLVEKVAVFLSGYVAQQWSWVLRGASVIGNSIDSVEAHNLESLAGRIEYGVRHLFTANLMKHGCPVDRSKVDRIVSIYSSVSAGDEPTEGALLEWLRESGASVRAIPLGYFSGAKVTNSDVDMTIEFLESRIH